MSQLLDSALYSSISGAKSSASQVQSSAESLLNNFYQAANNSYAFESGWEPLVSKDFPVDPETLFEDARLSPATFSATTDSSLVSAQGQSLEQSFTSIISAQQIFKANIEAFKVADETAQAALDLIA